MDRLFSNHPIRIRDLQALRDLLGVSAVDMAWLLGMPMPQWGALMRDARLDPEHLAEPSHALLARWLADHRQHCPSVHGPQADSFLLRLRQAAGRVTMKAFALSLGWEASAGYRWLRRGAPIGPTGRRALSLLDDIDPGHLAANWAEWQDNARHEARLRGFDLGRAHRWPDYRCRLEVAS